MEHRIAGLQFEAAAHADFEGRPRSGTAIAGAVSWGARRLLRSPAAVCRPSRICLVAPGTPLPDATAISTSPRIVAFVDVPPGARCLPQAAELNDGRVVTFFSPLIEKLKRDGGTLPGAYPHTTATDAGKQQRDAYWDWFAQHWNADEAVKVVEDGIGDGGRPRWIDYRMAFGTGQELHLHVAARGDYDTGVFAYGTSGAANASGCGSSGASSPSQH